MAMSNRPLGEIGLGSGLAVDARLDSYSVPLSLPLRLLHGLQARDVRVHRRLHALQTRHVLRVRLLLQPEIGVAVLASICCDTHILPLTSTQKMICFSGASAACSSALASSDSVGSGATM